MVAVASGEEQVSVALFLPSCMLQLSSFNPSHLIQAYHILGFRSESGPT